eukprot:1184669-Prorocentrum_minimum.AAC.2
MRTQHPRHFAPFAQRAPAVVAHRGRHVGARGRVQIGLGPVDRRLGPISGHGLRPPPHAKEIPPHQLRYIRIGVAPRPHLQPTAEPPVVM